MLIYIMQCTEKMGMERKIINITGKRQVTIPLKFFEKLRFGKEAECILTDDAVILRPLAASDDNFTMEILKDLVAQGYSGDELLAKFAEQRANIKKTINVLIKQADEIAAGKRAGASMKDVLGKD